MPTQANPLPKIYTKGYNTNLHSPNGAKLPNTGRKACEMK